MTYGAGGSTRERTHATVARIIGEAGLPAAAHLTCVAASKAEIREVAEQYWGRGRPSYRRVAAATRGEPGAPFTPHPEGLCQRRRAGRGGLKNIADFEVSVAAYPETHPDALSPQDDIDNLKRKLECRRQAGRSVSSSFRAETFFRFRDQCAAAGIDAPDPAGHPAGHQCRTGAQIRRRLPGRRSRRGWTDCSKGWMKSLPRAIWSPPPSPLNSAVASMRAGVRDFHFYTLNRPELAYAICHMLGKRPVFGACRMSARHQLLDAAKERVLIFDGAFGTQIQNTQN